MCEETRVWKEQHSAELSNLAKRQDKHLLSVQNTVKNCGDLQPSQFILDVPAMGPKHPVVDDFREMHPLADIDELLCSGSKDKLTPLPEVDFEVVTSTLKCDENKQFRLLI